MNKITNQSLKLFREQFIFALLGIVIGLLAGFSSWAFLESLHIVTEYRIDHDWLLYLLPIAAFVVVGAFHHWGGKSSQGNALLLDQIHTPSEWVPRRMSLLVFGGTVLTHLFGGSVGREGAALQMSGSLSDGFSRLMKLSTETRRVLLIASLAGGFGAVFGVPIAGTIFAIEVQSIGKFRFKAIVASLIAAFVGDKVVLLLGYHHTMRDQITVHLDAALVLKLAFAGAAFGVASIVFVELTHIISRISKKLINYSPIRALLGGVIVVILALLFGHDYLGLSLGLIDNALTDHSTNIWIPVLKIVFTAICLGCAFPGGEVTPLFVIGATLGAFLAAPLGVPVVLLAAVGFVAVFAGAANTPVACSVMAVEIFGLGIAAPVAVACLFAFVFSNHRGIYNPHHIVSSDMHQKSDLLPKLLKGKKRLF